MDILRRMLDSLGIRSSRGPVFGEPDPPLLPRRFRLSFLFQALALVACLTALAAMVWSGVRHLVLSNEMFAFESFVLETDGHISKRQAMRWSGAERSTNILALDLAETKRNLERVPLIREVAVERIIPDCLRFTLQERKPVFRIGFLVPGRERIRIRPYLMDRTGYVYSPFLDTGELEQQRYWKGLPELIGVGALPIYPGEKSVSPKIRGAIRLLESFRESALAERFRIRSIDISRRGTLVARTSDGQEVTFGLESFAERIDRWKRILDRARRDDMVLLGLDLSLSNNHPIRWEPRVRRSLPHPRPRTVARNRQT